MKHTQLFFNEHYKEAMQLVPKHNIVCLALQGSQNYGIDTPQSDIDTKLIITPSLKEVALNTKPQSYTYIRKNNEHIDVKDVRVYIQLFKKQNLNFLEILFTKYLILNPNYADQWQRLIIERERIARYDRLRAVASMQGIAGEKYHALEHKYPSRAAVVEKYGYDPKQLCHLLRIREFIKRYMTEERYETCMRPWDPQYYIQVKQGYYNLEDARTEAESAIKEITDMYETAKIWYKNSKPRQSIAELLDDVAYQIIRISIRKELEKE